MALVGADVPLGADLQPVRRRAGTTAGELASDTLRVTPALGLSAADERVVTARAETFLDAALGGQTTVADTRRQALRLAAVLRATGNRRAAELAETLSSLDVDLDLDPEPEPERDPEPDPTALPPSGQPGRPG